MFTKSVLWWYTISFRNKIANKTEFDVCVLEVCVCVRVVAEEYTNEHKKTHSK